METEINDVTDEELKELNVDTSVDNDKAGVDNEESGKVSDELEPDTAEVINVEERSVVMNNNFILPMVITLQITFIVLNTFLIGLAHLIYLELSIINFRDSIEPGKKVVPAG